MDNIHVDHMLDKLKVFIDRFSSINADVLIGIHSPDEAERTLVEYTEFILDRKNRTLWEESVDSEAVEIKDLILRARRESAHCVWTMEKYRAMALLRTGDHPADYFKNIEECIADEFGSFRINKNSRVLLIGVGAFPMTPLLIARNIGSKVVGIDIDEEAIEYAQQVIQRLGSNFDIEVSLQNYASLEFTREATHIILASTIPEKFDILHDLYSLTNKDVVILMRYGNGFKSLFNYPLLDIPKGTWKKVEEIHYEDHVFDVVLYKK